MNDAILNGYEEIKRAVTYLANIRMILLNEIPKSGELNKRLSRLSDKNLNTIIADLANFGNLLGDIHNSGCDEFDTELLIKQFEESQQLTEQTA